MARRKKLKVFTANHEGHWLGGCSVVVAENKDEAYEILSKELGYQGLNVSYGAIQEIDLYTPAAHVLFNGDY